MKFVKWLNGLIIERAPAYTSPPPTRKERGKGEEVLGGIT